MDKGIAVKTEAGKVAIMMTTAQGDGILPALWLRERAESACQIDQITGQRLFNPHNIDPDLSIVAANRTKNDITIRFSDGYCGTFKTAKLISHASTTRLLPPTEALGRNALCLHGKHWWPITTPTEALGRNA